MIIININTSRSVLPSAAMVTAMDDEIGKVVQALIDTDKWDNTLIIFSSDVSIHALTLRDREAAGEDKMDAEYVLLSA